MVDKKYILNPGYVTSRSDGDLHFITAEQLARLYGVNMNDCIIYHPIAGKHLTGIKQEQLDKMQYLSPRSNGDYTLNN